MRSKHVFTVTTITQVTYLLMIILNFLCIWMFDMGMPYVYPFAMVGHFLILILPVEIPCIILNLIFGIKDVKVYGRQQKLIARMVISCVFFVLLCVLKIALYHYGNILTGVV